MRSSPRRHAFAAALLSCAVLAARALAGTPMTSGNNTISRDVDDGGGTFSSTANNKMTGSASEEIALTTASTVNNLLRTGFETIAYYPGTPTPATNGGVTTSSTTLDWATPGYDGNQGVALVGSAYLVQIASNSTIGNLNDLRTITITISTSAQAVGKIVGTGVTGLDPNTTYYGQVLLRDDDANVSGASSVTWATFVTLANPPTPGALEFTSIQWSSVAVAWIAPSEIAVSSKSNEGYTLLASSDNFGALAPPGGAPVISSTTFEALASTLTVGSGGVPLDLSSTYYFQVGSLNWAGQPNYATFNKLVFEIVRSTGLVNIHNIDLTVAQSTVATSSMVVTNVGNWPATIMLAASTITAPSSFWSLGTSSGVEQAALQGVWFTGALGPPAVGPPASAFATFLTTSPTISQASGNYSSASQNGFQLAPGSNITLWFRFFFPTSTSSPGHETIQVTAQPVYP